MDDIVMERNQENFERSANVPFYVEKITIKITIIINLI